MIYCQATRLPVEIIGKFPMTVKPRQWLQDLLVRYPDGTEAVVSEARLYADSSWREIRRAIEAAVTVNQRSNAGRHCD